MPTKTSNRPSHVPSGEGYSRCDNLFHELEYVMERLSDQCDEAFDAGDDITGGQRAHEANCIAFAIAELRKPETHR